MHESHELVWFTTQSFFSLPPDDVHVTRTVHRIIETGMKNKGPEDCAELLRVMYANCVKKVVDVRRMGGGASAVGMICCIQVRSCCTREKIPPNQRLCPGQLRVSEIRSVFVVTEAVAFTPVSYHVL